MQPVIESTPISELGHAGNVPVDRALFDNLLEMAGEEIVPELLAQLRVDLSDVSRKLARGLSDGDTETVRAQTHILISLAGSCGAVALQAQAERINGLAAQGDLQTAEKIGATTLHHIGLLSHFISHEASFSGDLR